LKDKELELMQKIEESQGFSRRIETALRMKHEEVYQINRDKEQLVNDLRNTLSIEDNLRQEVLQVCL
jgi:hypothetical protein